MLNEIIEETLTELFSTKCHITVKSCSMFNP